jgi:RNA polymerase sigma-70 factor (ECF subfamily)
MMVVRRTANKASPQSVEERLLVEAAQADPSKFDALYELHFERIYFFIVSRVHDRTIAEDLTSEVFHKALANLSSYEWRGTPFSAWLFRIASNAIADQYKRANREQQADDGTFDPPAPANISSKELEFVERHAFFFRLIEGLPVIQRRVVCERFIEERSIKEIAQRLKKSEGAIKQLQFRALQTLREQVGGRHA